MKFPFAKLLLSAAFLTLSQAQLTAETVKDRQGAVLTDRAQMQSNDRWIYNDWKKGFAESKRTGKPLLVVLRCVPCLACAGIDANILSQKELQPLLDKFICVRVINANALDLSLFQFDYDLSFSTIFFNGDGTVYGRFGSWMHQKNSAEGSTASYKAALDGALKLHANYPSNKDSLRGKQGASMPVNDPLQLPQLAGKYKRELDWEGKVVQSCVHCHQVSDAIRAMHREKKESIPQKWVYPMPSPETIGLTFFPQFPTRVMRVAEGWPGEKSGFLPGDEILELAGQPIISEADLAWILHNSDTRTTLNAKVQRDGSDKTLKLELPPGWRSKSDISRRVGTWAMRAMATGGMLLKDLPDEDRAKHNLSKHQLALIAEHVGEYGEHAAAKKAGFRKGDILIEIDDISNRMTESALIGHLLAKHAPGAKLKARVQRGTEKLDLLLPMQ